MRPRSRRVRALVVAATIVVLGGGSAVANPPSLPLATGVSPTGTFANGTVIPNGRLVTPAGRLVDLGDFPLGVAVSPDGRLVVAVNSGYGMGLDVGFGTYCEETGHPPCPYDANDPRVVAQVGDRNEPAYDESLSVVDTVTGQVRTVLAHPTIRDSSSPDHVVDPTHFNFFYLGAVFSPDGRHLYASGGGNDAIYDFPVVGDVVQETQVRTVVLPEPFFLGCPKVAGPLSSGYPIFGCAKAFTKGMAVSPDGHWLLVAHEFNNTLDIVDTTTDTLSQQVLLGVDPLPTGGAYPYTVVVSPDGQTAYVSCQGIGVVAVVALSNGRGAVRGVIPVGDHPTGLAISPDGSQLYVANADSDDLSIVDTRLGVVARTIVLHALDGEQLGSTPNAVAVSPDGQRLYVALAGDDAVAVLGTEASLAGGGEPPASTTSSEGSVGALGTALPNTAAPASPAPGAWRVGGMIPAGWYPSAVAVSPSGNTVYVVSAKGLGSRYLASLGGETRSGAIRSQYEYDGDNMPGLLQVVAAPSGSDLTVGWQRVRDDIRFSTIADRVRTPHNPIPARLGDPSPITHVIEIVRENRTFDQVFGDLAVNEGRQAGLGPAQIDADPDNVLFGRSITPNAHALAGDPLPGHPDPAFAVADNFYSDGEASIQGHWWTAAANVNDYVEKSWRVYYSNRNHVYDPESTISQPHNCTIFQAAFLKSLQQPGFTFRDYGELIGLANPSIAIGGGGPGDLPNPCAAIPDTAIDPQAIQNQINLDRDDRATATEFLNDIGLNVDGTPTGRPGAFLRSFSYLVLPADHTGGLAFQETPRSRVAENDAGLGMIVQAISHSSYWSSTAIFVMEDDSQDGLDHEDGHRNIVFVISPYAKHVGIDGRPGYVGHYHYSQASVLKTIELLLGLPHLSTYDQNASPLFDLFQDKDSPRQLTASDLAAYTLQPLPSFVPESTRCYGNTSAPPTPCPSTSHVSRALASDLYRRSLALDLHGIDRASPDLEIIAWQLAHPDRPIPQMLANELDAWRRIGPADRGD